MQISSSNARRTVATIANQLSEMEIKCNAVETYYSININIKQQNKNVHT